MTITTLDGVLAGMQQPRFFNKQMPLPGAGGRLQSTWPMGTTLSMPGPGGYDATTAGAALSSSGGYITGMLPFPADAAGGQFTYLSHLDVVPWSNLGTLYLCDRLWSQTLPGLSGVQTINSVAWPARDIAGSTNGDGVMIAVEAGAANGGSMTSMTLTYTDSNNNSGHTTTALDTLPSGAAVGSMARFGLQAGDTGVRSIQSINIVSSLTGTWCLVAYRMLAQIDLTQTNTSARLDFLTGGMVKAYNGTVPYLVFIGNTNSANQFIGTIGWTQG